MRDGLALIRASTARLGVETIAIDMALARIMAEPVHAQIDAPRFACSAMDGYAVRAADTEAATLEHPACFALAAPLAAGGIPIPLAPGTAMPISTGAPVPPGADAIVARETASLDTSIPPHLQLGAPVPQGINIRAPGEDIRASSMIVRAGDRIDPETIGLLSAAGISSLPVRKRPHIAYFSTGNEIAPSGTAPQSAFAIPDANRPMIAALVQEAGLACHDLGHAGDRAADIMARIASAIPQADIILSSGGVSGGAFDLVRGCVEAQGGEILFHGLDMRPGKPLLFARFPNGALYFGLPGNPVAALVGFRFFVGEAIHAVLGLPQERGEAIPSLSQEGGGPTRFLRLRTGHAAHGPIHDLTLDQRSHILSSAVSADAWLRIDGDTGAAHLFPKRTGRLT